MVNFKHDEALELVQHINAEDSWNPDLCFQLVNLAGLDYKWQALCKRQQERENVPDTSEWEAILSEACKKIGVPSVTE